MTTTPIQETEDMLPVIRQILNNANVPSFSMDYAMEKIVDLLQRKERETIKRFLPPVRKATLKNINKLQQDTGTYLDATINSWLSLTDDEVCEEYIKPEDVLYLRESIKKLFAKNEAETIKRVMEVIPKRTFDFPMGQSNEKEWWHNHGWNSAIDLMTDNINNLTIKE